MLPDRFDHPSFRTALGTGVSGVLLVLVMFVLLFAVPYALFVLL